MEEKTKIEELREFSAVANEEFGKGTTFLIGDGLDIKVETIPTGIGVIDQAIGVGGIPMGRITEVFGKEATGKTSLCLHTIKEAQKMGIGTAFIDAEQAISFERMEAIGVDTDSLLFSQPDSGEEALNLAELMIRSEKIGLIVIDSVAALTPQVEIDKDSGESVMGVHAKLMSQAMRKLAAPVNKFKVALIFTNQVRTNIGQMWGSPEVTTGGNALKFYASLRLKMQYKGQIKDSSGQRVSGKYQLTVVKNKLSTPFKEAEFELNQYGIDETGSLVDVMIKQNIITKAGSWIKLGEENLAQGKQSLIDRLHKEPELKEKLVNQLHKQA